MYPTKMKEDTVVKIEKALSMGNTRRAAYTLAGIAEITFSKWYRKGKEHDATGRETPYADFYRRVNRAESVCQVKLVSNLVDSANNGNWRAALALLERRFGEEWGAKAGPNEGTDVTVNVDLGEWKRKKDKSSREARDIAKEIYADSIKEDYDS